VKVKLSVKKNMTVVGDSQYEGVTLTILTITNVGRRPVTIRSVGAINIYPGPHFVAGDTKPILPCEITEGKFVTTFLDQAGIDCKVDYWAWDSHDRNTGFRSI
jgi:hypothetical protein